ncbi:20854_t:CDS:1, partial [Gigaspora rosea]
EIECFIQRVKRNIDQDNNITSTNSTEVGATEVGNPLQVQHKGRQPKRYKSGGELPKKKLVTVSNSKKKNKKGERRCQKCKQTGHYAPRCPN